MRRNNIAAIQDSSEIWIYEKDKIKDYTIQIFSTLYSCEHREFRPYPHLNCFPLVDNALLAMLKDTVDDAKIKRIVFDMHPLKALVPMASMQFSTKPNGTRWAFLSIS